jgi:hypothetical protein
VFIRSTRAESDVAQNAGLTKKSARALPFDEVEQAKVKQESLRDERGIPLSNFAVGTARSAPGNSELAAMPVRRVPHPGKTTEASINPRISREQKISAPV